MKKALIVIDVQNDYFSHGAYPLWNSEATLEKIKLAVQKAQQQQVPIILVQHIANPANGLSPFFNVKTAGVEIHSGLKALAAEATIITKSYADSFHQTNLQDVLSTLKIEEILLCGMMTQNCVTHTALSKQAEQYKVGILGDCCTTVDEMLHQIALHAVSPRIPLLDTTNAF